MKTLVRSSSDVSPRSDSEDFASKITEALAESNFEVKNAQGIKEAESAERDHNIVSWVTMYLMQPRTCGELQD